MKTDYFEEIRKVETRAELIEKYGDGRDAHFTEEERIENEINRILLTDRDLDTVGEAVDPANHVHGNISKGISWKREYEEYMVTLRTLLAKEDYCEVGRLICENAMAEICKVAEDRVKYDEV